MMLMSFDYNDKANDNHNYNNHGSCNDINWMIEMGILIDWNALVLFAYTNDSNIICNTNKTNIYYIYNFF